MRDCSAISRSFVVSFFTQRHPQTRTNITERNDGLIDGAKSRRRWDFGEFKDFISAASQSFPFTGIHLKTKDCGKVASRTWSFKIWLWKTWIFFYLQLTLKLSCWPLTHLHFTSSSYIWTSRTLSVKWIPLLLKIHQNERLSVSNKYKIMPQNLLSLLVWHLFGFCAFWRGYWDWASGTSGGWGKG